MSAPCIHGRTERQVCRKCVDASGIRVEIRYEGIPGLHFIKRHICNTRGCHNGCRGTRCVKCWEERLRGLEEV